MTWICGFRNFEKQEHCQTTCEQFYCGICKDNSCAVKIFDRNSRPGLVCKKIVLKDLSKFLWKKSVLESFFIGVVGYKVVYY